MKQSDIAIVGGGLAGATAAAMLGKSGYKVALIDPHESYPPEFRCEKLDASQVELLQRTGLAAPVLSEASHDEVVTVVRYGHVVGTKRSERHGIMYDKLVNSIRAQVPDCVQHVRAKVTGISVGPGVQSISLSDGDTHTSRLVILANGLHPALTQSLGIERRILSRAHSTSIGFDLKPVGRSSFGFKALTYFPEKASDGAAYMTIFPAGGNNRVNLFTYWRPRDPRLDAMHAAPEETLRQMWPRLHRVLGNFKVENLRIRPVDLYVTEGYEQHGIVLVGDAFATACPAVGVGANKVFTDVERLCNHHIPHWMATPGMTAEKIASFYADPVKRACDEDSTTRAFHLRSLSTNEGISWCAKRWARFGAQAGLSTLTWALSFGTEMSGTVPFL